MYKLCSCVSATQGGKFFFFEHIAARPGTRVRTIQSWLRPAWRGIADCTLTMETESLISRAGFAAVQLEVVDLPELKTIMPAVFRPMVALLQRNAIGTATK